VTVVVVTVAIAFLMNVLSESLVKRSIAEQTIDRVNELRSASTWAADLSREASLEEILQRLAGSEPGKPFYEEVSNMAGLSPSALEEYHKAAKDAGNYLDFFSNLNYGRRRALVHSAAGVEIFDRLCQPEHLKDFKQTLTEMKSVRFAGKVPEFEAFLQKWSAIRETTLGIQRVRAQANERISATLQGEPVIEALTRSDRDFGDVVREAGYVMDAETAKTVAVNARRMLEMRRIKMTLSEPEVRSKLAGHLDIMPGQVDGQKLWKLLRSPKGARWYLGKLEEAEVLPEGIDFERIQALAAMEAEERALTRVELRVSSPEHSLEPLGPALKEVERAVRLYSHCLALLLHLRLCHSGQCQKECHSQN